MINSQSLKKIKILYVVTQGELGGAQRYVFDLATHLNPNEYEILAVMGQEKTELKTKLEKNGIPVRLAKNLKRNINPLRDFLAVFELKKIILNFQPNIVHLNSGKAGFLGSIASRLAGNKNVVFTAHGFSFLEPNPWLVKMIYFWAEKIASRFRKVIITVSNYDQQAAIRAGLCAPEKLVTIHNGIPPLISPLAPPLAGIGGEEGGVVIGTIANLYPTKGLRYLIEAAHILYSRFSPFLPSGGLYDGGSPVGRQIPDSRFVVIGEGKERKNLESKIKQLGLEKLFILKGALPNALDYLSTFNIFVLPSVKEGFPYTLLEAMRAGLPIVATAVGGIPEAIKANEEGLLVKPRDPEALAYAFEKLLKNPSYAKTLGDRARERVKEFSLEKMLAKTLTIYRRI